MHIGWRDDKHNKDPESGLAYNIEDHHKEALYNNLRKEFGSRLKDVKHSHKDGIVLHVHLHPDESKE